jgi:hypothetical protein
MAAGSDLQSGNAIVLSFARLRRIPLRRDKPRTAALTLASGTCRRLHLLSR